MIEQTKLLFKELKTPQLKVVFLPLNASFQYYLSNNSLFCKFQYSEDQELYKVHYFYFLKGINDLIYQEQLFLQQWNVNNHIIKLLIQK